MYFCFWYISYNLITATNSSNVTKYDVYNTAGM